MVPDQLVAITGSPIAIASTCGRPHPSPRLGSTKASTALYSRGNPRKASSWPITWTSGRCARGGSPRSAAKASILASKSSSEWNALVFTWSETGSSAVNSSK